MSFVEWATAAVLLVITLGGLYGGVTTLVRRRVEVPPYVFEGAGAVAVALIYLGGAAAAVLALVLLFSAAP
jgi:hypothetical protein